MRKTTLRFATGAVIGTLVMSALFLAFVRSSLRHFPETAQSKGEALFHQMGCGGCHYTDSTETKVGPGLKGLFKRKTLPVSGRPVTEANVRRQLTTPFKHMPVFANILTDEQRTELIAYLKTL